MKLINIIKNKLISWFLSDRIEVYYNQCLISNNELIMIKNNPENITKYYINNLARELEEELLKNGMIEIRQYDSFDKTGTYGEKAVGLTFNPAVNSIKMLYSKIIDICQEQRSKAGPGEKAMLFSVAITEAQTAQMWAVKAVTFKE